METELLINLMHLNSITFFFLYLPHSFERYYIILYYYKYYIFKSAVKQLIASKIKVFVYIICLYTVYMYYVYINTNTCAYTGAGHIIRISSKNWFISLIPFKKWNLYNVYIHSTQTDIFQVFISFNFDDYNWQLMKTPNSVSQKIIILWKGSILKTPGATL